MNNAVMARAFAIATERGLTVMSHAEDREISPWDYRLAENIETVRNCHLAEYYGTRLHMCHVSTKESIDAIRLSRMKGARVSLRGHAASPVVRRQPPDLPRQPAHP